MTFATKLPVNGIGNLRACGWSDAVANDEISHRVARIRRTSLTPTRNKEEAAWNF
jgi:hypothetical protein